MNEASQDPALTEQEYVVCLEHERHMFAWTLERFGAVPPAEARARALQCYPYEPPDDVCRGLSFHDEAWHWAMLTLHGSMYWQASPGFEVAPAEYLKEAQRFRASRVEGEEKRDTAARQKGPPSR